MIGLKVASFGIGAKGKGGKILFQLFLKKENAMKRGILAIFVFVMVVMTLAFGATGATNVAQASPATGSISGQVWDANTGAPLVKPAMAYLCKMVYYLEIVAEVEIGNGTISSYVFRDLPPDTYYILISAEGGYRATLYQNVPGDDEENATPIVLADGQNLSLADMEIAPYPYLFHSISINGWKVPEGGGKVVVSGMIRSNTPKKEKFQVYNFTETLNTVGDHQLLGFTTGTVKSVTFTGPTKKRPIAFEDKKFSFTIIVPKTAVNDENSITICAGRPMEPLAGTEWIGGFSKGEDGTLLVSTTRKPIAFNLDGTPVWKKQPGR